MEKKIISLLIATVCVLNFSACGKSEPQRYDAQFLNLFDTVTNIIGYTDSKKDFEEYVQFIHDDLKAYHELYDIYNNYDGINNIKTINDKAGIEPVKVDKKIIDLLVFAKQKYTETNASFNIAMGSVLEIWHDYRTEGIDDPENAKLPPMERLKAAKNHTDINKIIIDEANSTVYLADKDMSIDVGSIGKGYATEQVCRDVEKKGFKHGLVSVGGNVRAIGNKGIDDEMWNVGVENPDKESDKKSLCTVKIDNMSLVTSGDYQRYYTVNGVQYHHIINDDTLMPSTYFRAVTILCKDSGYADALSTAVFNMPYEKGLEFINSHENIEAMWVFKNGDIKYSKNFKSYIKK